MSWQKRSIQLILGLPLALPIVSYAIEVGDTYVESGQNQPLNASINVTDIDPATFSVKIGNPAMYQQLGLSPEQPIDVKFQPTSSNGGKIILTSKQPVATPYTDVVLDIQNKGEKKVLPKTLLMPLGGNPTATKQAPAPLVAPPEPTNATVTSTPNIELPTATATETVSEPVAETTIAKATTTSTEPALATTNEKFGKASLPEGNVTYKSDSLIIQETKGSSTVTANTAPSAPSEPKEETTAKAKPEASETTTTTEPSEETKAESSNDTVSYTIQRNETLWTIANRVAKGSKKDVHTVMQEIIDQNPDAFENGDPAKIVANTKLQVPKYKTAPSQAAIKHSKQIRKQAGNARKPIYTKTHAKPVSAPHMAKPVTTTKTHKKVVKTRKSYPIVKQKYTPPVSRPAPRKTQLVIVAPQQSNGSAQGSVKTTTTTSTKVVNSQVAAQLEQKRKATAAQAAKVNALNSSISSSEQKIKIQNQKLAQLEQRLKELNKK